MSKTRTRIGSLLLAALMLFSLLPITALAVDTTVDIDSDQALANAIQNQQDRQIWNFAAGRTYSASPA